MISRISIATFCLASSTPNALFTMGSRTESCAVVHGGPGDAFRRPRACRYAGSERVTKTFRFVASTFSDVRSFEWETLASGVDGNFAYTVAVERYMASADGGPPAQTELRATHVYRREDGHWRAVHRHADRRPPDRAAN